MSSNFKIINASAGSGKTFSLVRNILKELFNGGEDSYKKILALTFTNNAANEMKKRILDELMLISEDNKSSKIFSLLKKDLNISSSEARVKAKRIANKILHNFSFFQVSTIDKFNHKIIRAFSQDLSLSGDFDLIIDQDEFKEQLINEFLDQVDETTFLSQVLTNFSLEKIEDNNSWDINYDLLDLMKIMLSESNIEITSEAEKLESKSFLEFKKYITKKISDLRKSLIDKAKELSDLSDKTFRDLKPFPYDALPKFLNNIINNEIDKKNVEAILKRVENNTLLKKEFIDQNTAFLEESNSAVLKLISKINKLFVYDSIRKNNTQNHIIQEIKAFSNKFQRDNNILLISEFNSLISENIADQPAPYIYEKLGTRFKNYFIDEFQDTSKLQWKNVIPLTSHAIEGMEENDSSGSLFLVGDPKQSLYRWRGADPEIFKKIINKKTPFYIEPNIEILEENFRSSQEIVKFNNSFFSFIKENIQLKEAQETFSSFVQNQIKTSPGLVSVSFLDYNPKDNHYESSTCEHVLEIVLQKKKEKVNLNDIAILLRSNDECSLISAFLLENNINVTSEEMLSIESSEEVVFLINLLKLKKNFDSKRLKLELLKFLSSFEKQVSTHDYIEINLEQHIDFIFKNHLKLSFSKFKKLDLYDSVEYVVNNTKFFENKLVYIQTLLDLILDFNSSSKKFKETFFDYWDRKKNKTKISPPKDLNAVKVLTIHKSKGLQFPVVILPFFDSKLSKTGFKTWIDLNEKNFSKKTLIQFSNSMVYFNNEAKSKHDELLSNMVTDSLNLMYVSLTRAQNENHIISKTSKDEDYSSFSGLIYNYVKLNHVKELKNNALFLGKENKLKTRKDDKKPIFNLKAVKRNENIDIDNFVYTDKSEKSFRGEVFHSLMESIVYDFQYEKVMDGFFSLGKINKNELDSINKLVKEIISSPEIKQFFNSKNRVFNEREIYLDNKEVIRPDKILFHNKNEISILDYKTGIKKQQDVKQVKNYISAMKKGGYKLKQAFLVYTRDELEIVQLA